MAWVALLLLLPLWAFKEAAMRIPATLLLLLHRCVPLRPRCAPRSRPCFALHYPLACSRGFLWPVLLRAEGCACGGGARLWTALQSIHIIPATIDSRNSTAAAYIHAIRLQLMAGDWCTAARSSPAGPLSSANQQTSPVVKPLSGLLRSFTHPWMNEADEMIDLRASCLSYDI